MFPIEYEDIAVRLFDLRAYSQQLSRKMEHEDELPDDAVPFLIERLEEAFERYGTSSAANRAEAHDTLGYWLVKSYRFYLTRLMVADLPWSFRFPRAPFGAQH